MRLTQAVVLSLCSLLLLALTVGGPTWAAEIKALKISPQLKHAFSGTSVHSTSEPDMAAISLRFSEEPNEQRRSLLLAGGFEPITLDGRWLHVGHTYYGNIDRRKLQNLAGFDFLIRAEPAVSPVSRPMDQARESNGIDQVYEEYTDTQDLPVTGKGVTICIDDSTVDIFHPAFFRPDGGDFDWIDVDDNQHFDPGVDAVDLNDDDIADENEILNFFDAHINRDYYVEAENTDGVFQPDLDYLYNDANSSGVREYGTDNGFTEQDPCYGEQLFFIQDDNENGKLDEGERLTALGSSKVVKAYVFNGRFVVSFNRGVDLIDYPFNENGFISHGTGTAGISASGQAWHRMRGVAYEADLVLVDSYIAYGVEPDQQDWINIGADLALCMEGGADISLHEYCSGHMHPLDGSSNDAVAITEAEIGGMLPICPTCNYKGGKKHTRFRIPPNSHKVKRIDIDPTYPMDEFQMMVLDLRWRQPDRDVEIQMLGQDGTYHTIEEEATPTDDGNYLFYYKESTERGTVHVNMIMQPYTSGVLSPPYAFNIVNNGATPLDMSGFVMDEQSSFSYGLIFSEDASDGTEQRTFLTTTSLPAGADGGLGIGAHNHLDGSSGLADYSSGGLRQDGAMTVHITGTYAQLTPGAKFDPSHAVYSSYAHGNFVMFGGTSSSSPLMAGISALVVQYSPDIDGRGLRKAVMLSSDPSNLPMQPDIYGGWGEVWAPSLLDATETAMQDEDPPLPTIYSENIGVVGEAMVFSGAGTLDDRGIDVWSWSIDDQQQTRGDFDMMWLVHTFDEVGSYLVNLEVTDEGGNSVTVSKTVEIIAADEERLFDEPLTCSGPCNSWQPSRCLEQDYACNCIEGTWLADNCEVSCASNRMLADGCEIGEDGISSCICIPDPDADGDMEEESDSLEDGDEIEAEDLEGESSDGDGDEDAEDDVDESDDAPLDPSDGKGCEGCSGGTPDLPSLLLFILLLLAAGIRGRIRV